MTRYTPLPEALGSVFSRAEATRAGISSRRLMQPDIEQLAFALYRKVDTSRSTARSPSDTPHPAEQWRQDHLKLLLEVKEHLPKGAILIGRSAAVLWGLPVPAGADHLIEIGRHAPARAYRRPGFRAHQVSAHLVRVVVHRGIPVTDPATTWVMLAPRLGLDGAVALGDAVLRRARVPGTQRVTRAPHSDLASMERAMRRGRRFGAALLREALPLLVSASASAPESHLRLRLQEWGLPRPLLDHDVFDREGTLIGCSEIAYPQYRLAVEYEGDHHRVDLRQWDRDIEKYRRYEQNGWEVIRVTRTLLYRRHDLLREQVLEALTRRGWTQTPCLAYSVPSFVATRAGIR